jgi:acyl-CoA thioester hydrolase
MPKSNIEFEIEFGETDAAGVVFYPNYFRWFDRATHHLLATLGWPQNVLLDDFHLSQPVIDCGCTFTKPLRYGDIVRIETSIVNVGETTFKVEQHIFHDNELVGSGFETRVWVKTNEAGSDGRLKVVPIPDVIAEKFKEKPGHTVPGKPSLAELVGLD